MNLQQQLMQHIYAVHWGLQTFTLFSFSLVFFLSNLEFVRQTRQFDTSMTFGHFLAFGAVYDGAFNALTEISPSHGRLQVNG